MEHDKQWTPLRQCPEIRTATYTFPGGDVTTTAIPVQNGIIIYSPGPGLSSSAAEWIDGDKDVYLVTGNSFHTLGVKEWLEQFPSAKVVVGASGVARQSKKCGREVLAAESFVVGDAKVRLLTPPKTRYGEVWLHYRGSGASVLCVADAFFNFGSLPSSTPLKLFFKLNRMGPGLETSRVFKAIALKDVKAYRDWAIETIDRMPVDVMIPCHGEAYQADDVKARLTSILRTRL